MASTTLFQNSIRLAASVLRRQSILAVLVIAVSCLTSNVSAEPVTLRFEATVSYVFTSPDATNNLDVKDGDRLMGRFSFEPSFLPPLDNPLETQNAAFFQPYQASLEIGASSFHTPSSPESLMLTAVNNTIVLDWGDVMQDKIRFDGALIPDDTAIWPSLGSAEFSFEFWGHKDLLDSAGIPSDVAVLNDFEFRRTLRVAFFDTSGGVSAIRAVIGELSVVPEPSSLTLILLAIGCGWVFTRKGIPT